MIQILINGLLLGANYSLIAIGYTLVFGVMGLLNLAHGEVFVAAGLITLLVTTQATPIWVAGLIAVLIGSMLGLSVELFSFRTVGYKKRVAAAVSTIGLSIVIRNSLLQIRGSSTAAAVNFAIHHQDFFLGKILISSVQIFALLIAGILMIGTHIFVKKTKWGMAMRASSYDFEQVRSLGIPIKKVALIVQMISGGLAGASAFLLALRIGSISPLSGQEIGLRGIAIMALGGLGSLPGAMVAGLGFGVMEAIVSYIGFTGYQTAVPWIGLIIILILQPRGLFSSDD